MPLLCCIKNDEKWFVYRKPVKFIFRDSRDEDPLCSLWTAEVFSVVASLPPNFFIFRRERIDDRKYVCGSQAILLRIRQDDLHACTWEFSTWSSCLVETHPHYQPEIPQVQEITLRTKNSTIKRPVLEQNSLLFIYSKIVLTVQWVALVI